MAPAFREGRHGDGLYDAGVQILSAIDALPEGAETERAWGAIEHLFGWLARWFPLLAFLLAFFACAVGVLLRVLLRVPLSRDQEWSFSTELGGSDRSDRGAWSGGGGRSGGGGASGSW
jgi:uncharacterized protein